MPDTSPRSGTTPEEALRHAVDSGLGFYDAAACESASRWAVNEIDRLRAENDVLSEAVSTIGTVIDRGIPDERKLTVVTRIVNGAQREMLDV